MERIVYLKGERINDLIFLEDAGTAKGKRRGLFKCFCGEHFECNIESVVRKNTRSCGCIHKKQLISRNTKHGLCNHQLYAVWIGIRDRCYNSKNKHFKNTIL